MRRSEIKGTVWTIPAGRTKSGIEQDVPLSEAAVRIIAAAPVIGTSDHVFTAKGKGPIAGYSDVKRKLDKRILELAAAEGRGAPGVDISRFKENCRIGDGAARRRRERH